MFLKFMGYALAVVSLSASFSRAATIDHDKRRNTKGGSLRALVASQMDVYFAHKDVGSLSNAFAGISLCSPRVGAGAATGDSTDDSGSEDSAPVYDISYSAGARTVAPSASSSSGESYDGDSDTESVESLSNVVIPEETRAVIEALQNCMYCVSSVTRLNCFVSHISTDLRAIVDRVDSGHYSESDVIIAMNSVDAALNKAEEKMIAARSLQEIMAPLSGVNPDAFEDITTRSMAHLITESVKKVSDMVQEVERRIAALSRTFLSVEFRVIEDDELKDASRIVAGSAEYKASRSKDRARKFGSA